MFVTLTTNRPGIQSIVVEVATRFAWACLSEVMRELLQMGFTCSLDMNGDQTGLQTVNAFDLDAALGLCD